MNINKDRYELALSFWTVALQFLNVVQNVSNENVSQGNRFGVVKDFEDGPISDDEMRDATRWSDINIIVPLLFNLLHGIELLIKGFIIADSTNPLKKHNIRELCKEFMEKYPNATTLNEFFDKYTKKESLPSILQIFLSDNSLTIDELYQSLRYPTPDFAVIRKYAALKYQGGKGISFFEELEKDISSVKTAAVELGESLKPVK